MFKKVIVAEDQDDINKGVVASLQELEVPQIEHVQYCDDAYLKIKRAAMDQEPFELLITDLSFNADHRDQKLSSGEDLSAVLRKEFPDLKIIMYSVEDRLQRVRHMMDLKIFQMPLNWSIMTRPICRVMFRMLYVRLKTLK